MFEFDVGGEVGEDLEDHVVVDGALDGDEV